MENIINILISIPLQRSTIKQGEKTIKIKYKLLNVNPLKGSSTVDIQTFYFDSQEQSDVIN